MAPSLKKQKVSEDGAAVATAVEADDGFDPDRGITVKPKSAKQSRTLFVRSLPAGTTNESLAEFFSQSAPLKHATAVLDKDTKKCKGIGFVTFAEAEDALKAVQELNGAAFEGKKINVEIAKPRHREVVDDVNGTKRSRPAPEAVQEKEQRTQQLQGQDDKNAHQAPPRLIVRNLPWSIKEPEQLSKLFLSYGKVKEVKLPKGRNGTLQGFGFVLLRGRKNAEKAMANINGKEVDGRILAVDFAAPKDVWEKQQQAEAGEKEQRAPEEDSDSAEPNEEELGVIQDDEDEDSDAEDPDTDEESGGVDLGDEESELEDDDDQEDDRGTTTIFIRNLPYTVDDDALYQHFKTFGPLRYARVVMDYDTSEEGRSRGTGFVCFHKPEDAQSCLKGVPRTHPPATRQAKDKSIVKHSLLEDTQADPTGRYTIDGRVLQVSAYVGRDEAQRLAAEGTQKRNKEDKRRLYLLREGTIPSNSPLYKSLSLPEVRMREASAKQRQKMVQQNPALHLSLTRLAIRNIPRHITSKDLKALARQAVVGFAEDMKAGKRQPLTKEELSRERAAMKEAERERKRKGYGLVKQAKVIFESREGSKVSEGSGAGRSRGYGFVEYTTHREALMGLRWLNGHLVQRSKEAAKTDNAAAAGSTDGAKRLIVEFAIENVQVVQRRQGRDQKSRQPASANDTGDDRKFRGDKRGKPKDFGNKRKRDEDAPKESKDEDGSKKEKDKSALRQQIIGRKRAKRRARKGGP